MLDLLACAIDAAEAVGPAVGRGPVVVSFDSLKIEVAALENHPRRCLDQMMFVFGWWKPSVVVAARLRSYYERKKKKWFECGFGLQVVVVPEALQGSATSQR